MGQAIAEALLLLLVVPEALSLVPGDAKHS